MKKDGSLSSEEIELWLSYANNNLDEVYIQSEDMDRSCVKVQESKGSGATMKPRAIRVNKHTIERNQGKSKEAKGPLVETDFTFKSEQFPVLGLYKNREKAKSGKYLKHGDFSDADGHITNRIRKRQARVDAEIDLHNMNQRQAHNALKSFIASCSHNDFKVIRIITGKGKGGVGVLKDKLIIWLNMHPIRSLIIGFDYAHHHDGGKGAVNVLLRR